MKYEIRYIEWFVLGRIDSSVYSLFVSLKGGYRMKYIWLAGAYLLMFVTIWLVLRG